MHDATAQQIRRQAWWPMTCGAFGQVMGNDPLFWFGPGWHEPSSIRPRHARDAGLAHLLGALPWWRLVPDVEGRIVTGWRGAVAGLERVTAAVTAEGDLAVAYLPVARSVDVDLGQLSGPTVEATWFDPASGGRTPAGRHEASRVVTLRSPFPEDAALLLRSLQNERLPEARTSG